MKKVSLQVLLATLVIGKNSMQTGNYYLLSVHLGHHVSIHLVVHLVSANISQYLLAVLLRIEPNQTLSDLCCGFYHGGIDRCWSERVKRINVSV